MIGTGLTMEAIEQNPIVYELMTDLAWTPAVVDIQQARKKSTRVSAR